jgi:hypothetical protein
MKRVVTLYEQGDHSWRVVARDPMKAAYLIDTNEYVIESAGVAMITDPGGQEIFPAVFGSLSADFDSRKITSIFSSHQDPDVISSLALWLAFNPKLRCHASWLWSQFIPHFGGDGETILPLCRQFQHTIYILAATSICTILVRGSCSRATWVQRCCQLRTPTCSSKTSIRTSVMRKGFIAAGWVRTKRRTTGATARRGWRSICCVPSTARCIAVRTSPASSNGFAPSRLESRANDAERYTTSFGWWTASTGQPACLITVSVTLPMIALDRPRRPCVPMMIKSALRSFAALITPSRGSPL